MQQLLPYDPLYVVIALLAMSIAPFFALMVTSFVKLSVVLSLVRNALGIQQIPPNMVINGLALVSVQLLNPLSAKHSLDRLRQGLVGR